MLPLAMKKGTHLHHLKKSKRRPLETSFLIMMTCSLELQKGLDFAMQPNCDAGEEQDLFSSVGGMDLGEPENSAKQMYFMSGSNGSVAREHPLGHIPSRTLLVRNIDSYAEDSEFRTLFEQYGDICTLNTACKCHGYIMISYYDIRAAWKAMVHLQNRLIMGSKLDIHYSFPKDNLSERDISQGMLIASNVDLAVSNDKLYHFFGIYGDVKEIRSISNRNHQRLIEFYDSRDAEAAFHALAGSRSSITGKQIKIEPTHPGGMKDPPIRWSKINADAFCSKVARQIIQPLAFPDIVNLGWIMELLWACNLPRGSHFCKVQITMGSLPVSQMAWLPF